MNNISVSDQPLLLNQLIEALNQASGGASQLMHQHRDPRWMIIRESIDMAKDGVLEVATFSARISTVKPS